MLYFLKVYMVAVVSFFAIDMAWLGFIAKKLYREELGFIMKTNFNWMAAFIFYFIYIFGLVYFAINPALAKGEFTHALLVGALFGFMTYATYDLTNLATLEGWPLKITLIDMAWGTFLGASVSSLTYYIVGLFK